jgi:endoglucanase
MGNRRSFIKSARLMGAATAFSSFIPKETRAKEKLSLSDNPLPRWRGFNLQYIYMMSRGINEPVEEHFKWIADWGCDFVRLPLTYRSWLKYKPQHGDRALTVDDVYDIDECTLEFSIVSDPM